MERIGIVSMYHKSRNYGGLLQAYALCMFLRKKGYDAKQIDLLYAAPSSSRIERFKANPVVFFSEIMIGLNKRFLHSLFSIIHKDIVTRNKKSNINIDLFRNQIPHYSVDSEELIQHLNNVFDCFICGSDQIWNPYAYREEYFLSFSSSEKQCIAYAASISKNSITEEEINRIVLHLDRFSFISVREVQSKRMLEPKTEKEIRVVLDPTFLFSKEDWSMLLPPCYARKKYLFYYCLESDWKRLRYAKRIAKEKNLVLVSIPCVSALNSLYDLFAKYECAYVDTPFDFINLIKNAEIIITDSFHAIVFSLIFEKQFFCFECRDTKSLYPRVERLFELYECGKRLLNPNRRINYTEIEDIDYVSSRKKIMGEIEKSANFLINSISFM